MGIVMPLDLSGIDFALKVRQGRNPTDDYHAVRSETR
jgi:hypothetical protein